MINGQISYPLDRWRFRPLQCGGSTDPCLCSRQLVWPDIR